MHGLRDFRNDILRTGRSLNVGEQENPTLGRQPSSSSRAMLVLPMRRCPVSNTWLWSRSNVVSTCNSRSRPKKSSPLTHRPVADFMF